MRYVAELDPEGREDTDAMLILFRLCHRRTLTASQIAPVLQKREAGSESDR